MVFERIMEAESSEQEEKQATIGPSNTLISELAYQIQMLRSSLSWT